MNLPAINRGTPTNENLYDIYIEQISSEYLGFYQKLNKNVFGIASYIYEQVKYGIDKFGKDRTTIIRDVEKQLDMVGYGLKPDTIRNYYQMMEFVMDLRTSDRILYDKMEEQIIAGRLKMSPLGYLATTKRVNFEEKKQIIKDHLLEKVKGGDMMAYINNKSGTKREMTNLYNGNYIPLFVKMKYFEDADKIFMPFGSEDIIPDNYVVPDKNISNTFYIDGIFSDNEGNTIPDNTYDGVFLALSCFLKTANMERFPLKNPDDLMNRMSLLIKEAFRVTKLDGNVCVLTWDRKMFGEVVNYSHFTHNEMEKHGDWFNTAVCKIKGRVALQFFPNASYKTVTVFKKR